MNKTLINLKEISNARNFIYGIAILWIVFFHCGLRITSNFWYMIKLRGDCGVEIFFFLSGCSLYFSYIKKPNALTFYKRRLLRTMPYYLIFYGIVFAYFNLIAKFNFGQFLLNYSMLDFWLHGLGNVPWFLAALLVFYALYPLIYLVFFGEHNHKWLYRAIFVTAVTVPCVVLSIYYLHLRIFLYRVPVFLLGCVAGKFVYEGRDLKFYHALIIFVCLIIGKILCNLFSHISVMLHVYYLPLSLMTILILTQVYKFFTIYCNFVDKIFEYIGTITLEIYLTHEKVQENVFRILNKIGLQVQFNNTIYQIACVVLAIGISIGLSMLIKLIIKLCIKKKNQPQQT